MIRNGPSGAGIQLTQQKFEDRFESWCRTRGINSDASLATWINTNVTTLAQLRTAFIELLQALTDFVPPRS